MRLRGRVLKNRGIKNKELANFHHPKGLWYSHVNEMTVRELHKLPTEGPMKLF